MTSQFTSINKLSGTRVLIVGGTSGIGFAVARAALEHGASIIVASSKAKNVDLALSRFREMYPEEPYLGRIAGTTCDLGDQETLEKNVVELLEEATGDIFPNGAKALLNHIVYTAGDSLDIKPLTAPSMNISYIHKLSTVRFLAPLLLAKHTPQYQVSSPTSSITFTSGTNIAKPAKGWSVPVAVISAVEGMTRGLAVDLAPVRVNTVSPGAVLTELLVGMLEGAGEGGREIEEMFRGQTLGGKLGRPGDVAEGYVYCMKDGFVTGVVLESSGGRLLT